MLPLQTTNYRWVHFYSYSLSKPARLGCLGVKKMSDYDKPLLSFIQWWVQFNIVEDSHRVLKVRGRKCPCHNVGIYWEGADPFFLFLREDECCRKTLAVLSACKYPESSYVCSYVWQLPLCIHVDCITKRGLLKQRLQWLYHFWCPNPKDLLFAISRTAEKVKFVSLEQ